MRKILFFLLLHAVSMQQIIIAQTCSATITAGGPTTFCAGGTVRLSANTGGNTWSRKADFGGLSRQGAASFTIGSKGYIGTGQDAARNKTNDFWEYDPTNDTWTQKANFGGSGRINAVGLSIGSKGYIGTGYDVGNKRDFWEYDPTLNTWTQKANYGGTFRTGATGFSIGNKGYIGTGKSGTRKNDFWEYDPATNTWAQKANFPGTGRDGATSFSIGTKGYLGLGFDISGSIKSDFYEYNPTNDTWVQKANFAGSLRHQAVGFSIGNSGYAAFGINVNVRKNDLWQYTPLNNSWTQKAVFPGTARRYASVFVIDGFAYAGMGQDQKGAIKKDIWSYEPSYTHLWSSGEISSSIDVTTSGSYTVTVSTSVGCNATSAATDVLVKTLAAISDVSASVNPVCPGTTTNLTANGVEGTNALVNWWTGSGGTGTNLGNGTSLNGVGPGIYYAVVTADCGTQQEASITITENVDAGILSADAAANPICGTSTTTLTATGVTGTNATVNWWTGAGGTGTNLGSGTTLPNVARGTYYARVTADCGTPAEASVTIDTILVTRSDTTVAICNSYRWNDSTYKISGDYEFITTGSSGCDSVATLHLTILSVTSTFSKLDAACFADSSGSLIIMPTYGVWPFTYRIGTVSSYVPDSIFTNLRAGSYRVSILDAEGCAGISDQIIIGQTPAITATYSSTNVTCVGTPTGSITVNPTSGVPPYLYKLGTSGTYGTSNNFTNLKAGSYRVYIQDANGCTGKTPYIRVAQAALITGNLNIVPPTCHGTATGSLSVTPTNGVSPYQYRLGTTGTYGVSNTFINLKAGSYRLYIQDATGCIGSSSVPITQPTAVTATEVHSDATCIGGTDGSITVSASGGTPPYEYKFGTAGTYGVTNNFTGLSAGIYRIFVKDANDCLANSVAVTLNEAPISCGPKIIPVKYSKTTKEAINQPFEIVLLSNPTINQFSMLVRSSSEQKIETRVLNINGKIVYQGKILPNQTITFGHQFQSGIYMVEVRQGEMLKTIKAIKIES